jgi:hypothetical protein
MEKRKSERAVLSNAGWQAELIDRFRDEKIGEVINLSATGLLIIASRSVRPDSLYQVACVSKGPRGQAIHFVAGVMVLWSSPASETGTHWAGMQIIDIDAQSEQSLLALKSRLVDS